VSRSGYSDDYDSQLANLYLGRVMSTTRGKRGQAFLKDMLVALDALPEPKLIAGSLVEEDGAVCAMGAVAKQKNIDVKEIDPEDAEKVAATFGISECLAREIAFQNDDDWGYANETPEARFQRVRKWVAEQIKE
jgi:hypothetical protein